MINSATEVIKSVVRWFIRTSFRGPFIPAMWGPLKGNRIPRNRGLDQLSMLFGTYEPHFANTFYHRAKNADSIYDIGCNYGYFTLLGCTNLSASVYAFEPVPSLGDECMQLLDENNLAARVDLIRSAVSDNTGKVAIVTPGSDKTGLMASALRGQPFDEASAIEVPCTSIDAWLASSNASPPQLMKIDVEGAEGLVLKGAEKTIIAHQPDVLVEVHGEQPAIDVWNFATRIGYHVSIVASDGLTSVDSLESWVNKQGISKWTIEHVLLTPPSSSTT